MEYIHQYPCCLQPHPTPAEREREQCLHVSRLGETLSVFACQQTGGEPLSACMSADLGRPSQCLHVSRLGETLSVLAWSFRLSQGFKINLTSATDLNFVSLLTNWRRQAHPGSPYSCYLGNRRCSAYTCSTIGDILVCCLGNRCCGILPR